MSSLITDNMIAVLLYVESDLRNARHIKPRDLAEHWTHIDNRTAQALTITIMLKHGYIETQEPPKGRINHQIRLTPAGMKIAIAKRRSETEGGLLYMARFAEVSRTFNPRAYAGYNVGDDFYHTRKAAVVGIVADYRRSQETGQRHEHNELGAYQVGAYRIDEHGDAQLVNVQSAVKVSNDTRYDPHGDGPNLYDWVELCWKYHGQVKRAKAQIVRVEAGGYRPAFVAQIEPGATSRESLRVKRMSIEELYGLPILSQYRIQVNDHGKQISYYKETLHR